MKINDEWFIAPGPTGQDYELVYEKFTWNDEKQKWSKSSQKRFYPTIDQAIDSFVRQAGIDAVGYDNLQEVKQYLDELKESIKEKGEENDS